MDVNISNSNNKNSSFLGRLDTPVLHEQVRSLYRQSPFLFIGILVVMAVVMVFFWNKVDHSILLSWFSLNMLLNLARVVLVKSFHRINPNGESLLIWGAWFAVSSTISGIIWGSIAFLFLETNQIESVLLVSIILTGMSAGSLVPLSSFIPAYLGFVFFSISPLAVVLLIQQETVLVLIGYMMIAFIAVNLGYSFVVNRNLAESIRLRFENLELIEKVKNQIKVAEQANLDKSRFLAATSHDLRQPLHALDLFLGAIKVHTIEPKQQELLQKATASSHSLSELLNALMDVSRLDAGAVETVKKPFNLLAVIQLILTDFEQLAKEKNISIRQKLDEIMVFSDPVLFARMVRNLVANAINHNENCQLELSSRVIDGQVELLIKDNGRGIHESELDKVFSEFYQLNNPERDRRKGLGLGLAIVKRLSDLLNIPIKIESKLGQGVVFSLRLLLDDSDISQIDITQDNADYNLAGLFVCVVDDEVMVRDAIKSLLRSWDCEILVSDSRRSIMNDIHNNGYPAPDIIISDYRLREHETGLEVIKSIRELFNKQIPAIIVTGDSSKSIAKQVTSESCQLLLKPVNSDMLRQKLVELKV